MIRIILILGLLQVLWGQFPVIEQSSGAIRTAQMLERQGDIDGAIAIYRDLLSQHPANHNVYRRLKGVFRRYSRFDEAIQLIEQHLIQFPNDIQSLAELGEFQFLQGDTLKAHQSWFRFEERFGDNPNPYRVLLHTYSRLSLIGELLSSVDRGRQRFNDPAFMALEMANYFTSLRNYSGALDEITRYLVANPRRLNFVTDKILAISDEPETEDLIEIHLLESIPKNELAIRQILAAYYFKSGRYLDSFNQHRNLGIGNQEDQKRWLDFARSLRLEKEFDTAIQSYEFILSREEGMLPAEIVGKALLGLGQTFQDQIIPQSTAPFLVDYFQDNVFFQDPYYHSPQISSRSLESAFQLYDSIVVNLPTSSISAEAHYRLGEIQYRITRDFDGAQARFLTAQETAEDKHLRDKARLRVGDLYLARGELETARDYFRRLAEPGSDREFLNRYILARFLSGETDSVMMTVDSLLAVLMPTDASFNDLMEFQDLIHQHHASGSTDDKAAFALYIKAVTFLRQHKLSQAGETLAFLRENYPQVTIGPLSILREALTRISLGEISEALVLARELTGTSLADRGWVLSGEITERYLEDPERALEFYHRILESYPGSILREPVRHHIRELNEMLES